MMNPTAPEILLKVAELLEAENKWSAALNRPDPESAPFEASDIDAQMCRPLRAWIQALDPAHLRALATAPVEAPKLEIYALRLWNDDEGRPGALMSVWASVEDAEAERVRFEVNGLTYLVHAIQVRCGQGDAQLITALAAPTPQPELEQDQVGELLAIMHSDGGHYQTEHGTQKAARDAIEKHITLITRLDAAEYALKAQPQPAPSAETGNHVSGLTPAPDALREALVSLRAEKPISHAIKPWGEEMRELMAAFERHAKGQRHITVPRLDREEWKGRNGSYYQNGETNSLFLMFMAGYQSAKPGWLDGHYHDWHKERAALAEAGA